MALSNTHINNGLSRDNMISPYFIITFTNYPNLIRSKQQYQILNQYYHRSHQGAILIPGVRVHFGANHTDEHERLLFNTVRFRIQEILREYLQFTRRPYPFHLIFDMSDLQTPL